MGSSYVKDVNEIDIEQPYYDKMVRSRAVLITLRTRCFGKISPDAPLTENQLVALFAVGYVLCHGMGTSADIRFSRWQRDVDEYRQEVSGLPSWLLIAGHSNEPVPQNDLVAILEVFAMSDIAGSYQSSADDEHLLPTFPKVHVAHT